MLTKLLVQEVMQHPIRSLLIIIGIPLLIAFGIFCIVIVIFGGVVSTTTTSCGGGGGSDSVGDISGSTSGEWTKKGTSAYKEGKATYQECIHYGMDAIHAAAATGNAAHESAGFTGGLKRPQIGGGGGQGLFQFTGQTPRYGWSPIGQVKSIMANGTYPGEGKHWMHKSGDLASLTNSFEEDFERGGIPDNDRRDVMAKEVYKLFHGLSGSAGSAMDTDDSSSGGCSGGGDTDDSDVISFGKKYLGLKYSQSARFQSIKDIVAGKPKSETAENDCDGFVYAVLKHCGYKVPSQYWGDVAGMDHYYHDDIIPKSESHSGTPATYPPGAPDYGKLGHAFFLMAKWHGKDTDILGEGPQEVCIKPAWWVLTGGDLNDIHCYKVEKK